MANAKQFNYNIYLDSQFLDYFEAAEVVEGSNGWDKTRSLLSAECFKRQVRQVPLM